MARPDVETLGVQVRAKAVDNTPLARMFATNKNKRPNQLLKYLPDGAVMTMATNMKSPFCEEATLTQYDIMSFMGGGNIPNETMAEIQAIVAELIRVTDDVVMSMEIIDGNDGGFLISYVAQVTDGAAWRRINEQMMQLWGTGGFGENYQESFDMKLGYESNDNVETYRGVAIGSEIVTMEPTDPNSELGKLVNNVWSGGILSRWAVTDGLYLQVTSSRGPEDIRSLIDKVKDSSATIGNDITNAINMLNDGEACDIYGTYDHLGIIKLATMMMPDVIPFKLDFVSESKIAYGAASENGIQTIEVVIPKQYILDATNAFKSIGNQMQQKQAEARKAAELAAQAGPVDPNAQ